jgi:hypothetical protein
MKPLNPTPSLSYRQAMAAACRAAAAVLAAGGRAELGVAAAIRVLEVRAARCWPHRSPMLNSGRVPGSGRVGLGRVGPYLVSALQ